MILIKVIVAIAVVIVCGKLWRLGGDGVKWARGIVMPTLLATVKALFLWHWVPLLYAPVLYLLLSAVSYGVTAPPHRFVVWLFKGEGSDGNNQRVEEVTRGLCGFFWSLASIVFVIVSHHYWLCGLYMLWLPITNAIFGTDADVEFSERMVGMCVAMSILC